MLSTIRLRSLVSLLILTLLLPVLAAAQTEQPTAALPQPPALITPAGSSISLATSEVLFDIGAALNACGYNDGLSNSQPVRLKIRQAVAQNLATSTAATADRDKLCVYFERHDFSNSAQNLAQYISLGLYLTPPPQLKLSVPEQSLPPDANGVLTILPLLRAFVADADLHFIWVNNQDAYDRMIAMLHEPISNMTLAMDLYLKQPLSSYSDRRFLVVVDPMFDPADTNARFYGGNYVVVVSPSKGGTVHMQNVKQVYLHYEIEPLLYARANAIDRLQPFLNMVQNAPISFQDKSGIVPFVVECLVRAIQARTMDTGIAEYKIPATAPRSDYAANYRKRKEYLKAVAKARQQAVDASMLQGYVLTEYFYQELIAFEHTPTSLSEAIGPMVYGMDVPSALSRVKSLHLHFAQQAAQPIVENTLATPDALDSAESLLMKDQPEAAAKIAEQALADHTKFADRAYYTLARASLLEGNVGQATENFKQTIAASKDPRLVAWSHIYLGRIDDVNGNRPAAIAQYNLALQFEDGSQDTIEAAQAGLAHPYQLPGAAQPAPNNTTKAQPKPKLNLNAPNNESAPQ